MLDDYQQRLVLELLGRIATFPYSESWYSEAETVLKKIGHIEYARRCDWCSEVPAAPHRKGFTLCPDCSQEEEAKYVE